MNLSEYKGMTKPKEQALVRQINDYLTPLERMKRLAFIRLNTGAFVGEYKGKSRFVKYGKTGWSDFIIFLSGVTLFIECKAGDNKQTAEQSAFEKLITGVNIYNAYRVVRTYEEFIGMLERWEK